MKELNDNFIFIKNIQGIKSPTFSGRVANQVLSIIDSYDDININSTEDEIIENLSNEINCNPDGVLVFIESKYADDIKTLIEKELLYAYENHMLNFTNGYFSETILFHDIKEGLIIEMIDPECFSDFFLDLVESIKVYFDNKFISHENLLIFYLTHMFSQICNINNLDGGPAFTKLLKNNNFPYYE